MITSTETKEIYAAIIKAQTQVKAAVKDTANPFFKSKYANLETVQAAVRDALIANDLAVVQGGSGVVNGQVFVETTLIHTSGQHVTQHLGCVPKDTGPQAVGSAVTYLRRYGLAAILNVPVADDDGEAGEARPTSGIIKERSAPVTQQENKAVEMVQKTFKGSEVTNVITDDHRKVAAEVKRLKWPVPQQHEFLRNRYGADKKKISDLSAEQTLDALKWLTDIKPESPKASD